MAQLQSTVLPIPLINSLIHLMRNTWNHFWPKKICADIRPSKPPYHHFVQIGDPQLRNIASPVSIDIILSADLARIIQTMIEVLRRYDCVGVAAPQIGVPLRIIAMEFSEKKRSLYSAATYKVRQMSPLPLTIIINPKLFITSDKKSKHPEHCMSVKGYEAMVERADGVKLTGFNIMGKRIELELEGWNAHIAQHEMDHLDGKIYVDRMNPSTFKYRNWEHINDKCGHTSIWFDK